jgi:hypothetical protein
LVILYISTNFTFTYKVSKTPSKFKLDSQINFLGKLSQYLKESLSNLLCNLLHLVMWSKTRTIRFTAAAGTNLACALFFVTFIIITKNRVLQRLTLSSPTETYWVVLEYIAQDSLLLPLMFRHCLKPVVADHSSKPAKHLRLGWLLTQPTTIILNKLSYCVYTFRIKIFT